MALRFKGFTLLEILVTVAIIAIITTFAVVATQGIRIKARDTNRVSNVNQVVSALEQYYARTSTYPTVIVPGEPLVSGSATFLSEVPKNPLPHTDGGCPNSEFHYQKLTDGYELTFCLGADSGRLKKGINICKNGNCQPCGVATTKDLDGNEYKTVAIGGQCWMAENLRTKLKPDGTCINGGGTPPCPFFTDFEDDEIDQDQAWSCYDNSEANCLSQGALYSYSGAALSFDGQVQGARSICPVGWHIPKESEWHTLEKYLSDGSNCDAGRYDPAEQASYIYDPSYEPVSWGCHPAGQILKDPNGFNAVAAGTRGGQAFYEQGSVVTYWSNSKEAVSGSYGLGIFYRQLYWAYQGPFDSKIRRGFFDDEELQPNAVGVSVRCVKDFQ